MSFWLDSNGVFGDADVPMRAALTKLTPMHVPKGATLFRSGDLPEAFVVLLSGRVAVHLTGQNGREIMLYTVEPGQSCVQTTLGLLSDAPYTCEALAETDLTAVAIPRPIFLELLSGSERFRGDVFRTLAARLSAVMHVLELVAFTPVDARLAAALLAGVDGTETIAITHSELARQIGSVREVVSRRLEAWRSQGLIALERGKVVVLDRERLTRLSA